VLDLKQTIKDERGPRIPVEAEPPQLRQQPGVGRVTAIDRQLDRPTGPKLRGAAPAGR